MKKIILIPTRINSTRLPAKALLEIEGKPIIIHTFKSDFITPYPTPTVSIQFPFSLMLPI